MRATQALAQLVAAWPVAGEFSQFSVAAVNTDGTVDLRFGTQVLPGVPALRGYTGRAVDDFVWVLAVQGQYVVFGPTGPPSS